MNWKDKYPQYVTKNGGVKPNTPVEIKQEIFILRANDIHGNRYDYSQVVYVNNSTKVTIVCPQHGPWESIPNNHITCKAGCRKCHSESLLKPLDKFIEGATDIHGKLYDYSNVVYTGAHSKVRIVCKEHGEFLQEPNAHLKGKGCPTCARNKLKTTEKFIEDARRTHGTLYLYDNVIYSRDSDKVTITCRAHGDFSQTASAHLQGQGCPACRNRSESNLVYIFSDPVGNYKIGISHDINKRKKRQESSSGLALCVVAYKEFPGEKEARELERQIHTLNYENPYSGSAFDGYTEWRTIPKHDLEQILTTYGFIRLR